MQHRDRAATLVHLLVLRRWWVIGLACVLAVAAGWRTVQTYRALRSDFEDLLPESALSVTALTAMRDRIQGLRHLVVVVDTGDPANVPAASRFLDDLAARVRAYPPELVVAVRTDFARERQFVSTYALQLMDPADVKLLAEAVAARHEWEVQRIAGIDLLDDGDIPPPVPLDDLKRKYEARYVTPAKGDGDRFLSEDGRTAVMLIQAGSQSTGYDQDNELILRVRADVSALGFPERYAPGMRYGLTAEVAERVEEMQGLISDLTISGLLVGLLVLGSIVWFFHSWRSLPVLGIPLGFGTLYAFGLVALPPLSIRYLNANTAFLGSIVVGNGINCGIMLLARYREERREHDLMEALVRAVRETWRPTLAASTAASVAYGSLIITDFRGFNQFGWIGAIGLLTCWLATFALAPCLISLFARDLRLAHPPAHASHIQPLALRHRGAILTAAVLACVVSAAGLSLRSHDWFESDMSRLRRRDSQSRVWGERENATLKTNLVSTVILARDAADAEKIAGRVQALIDRGGAGGLLSNLRTLEQWLPATREESLKEARELRSHITPAVLNSLDPKQRAEIEKAISPASFVPLTAADIPDMLTAGLRERDGQLGRQVLVFTKLSADTWNVDNLQVATRDLREAVGGAPIAGTLLLSTDILTVMKADGPKATLLAIVAVLLIALLSFRSLRLSLAAILSLLVGILMMLGVLAWSGQRINFCNFVTLPITFGIAADYSVNMLRRFHADGDTWEFALERTSGAVFLCSLTTILGFGSLLVAKNMALFSFGVFAVTGEIACLLTATVLLPAFLRGKKPPGGGSDKTAVRDESR